MVQHRIPHDLDVELARRATRRALETYRAQFAQYDPRGEWLDDDHATVGFTVLGTALEGTVEVRRDEVLLGLEVPLVWRVFRGVAIKIIEGEIRAWIERARRGELD